MASAKGDGLSPVALIDLLYDKEFLKFFFISSVEKINELLYSFCGLSKNLCIWI